MVHLECWSEFWNSGVCLANIPVRKSISWPLNSSNIPINTIRILVDWLSIQKFRWLSNSSRLKWPQNSFEILQGFWSDIFLKIKWPRNSYEILQGWSEFWLSAVVSNNSDDYEILQELDDNRILVKFFWDLIRIFEEVDDHGILMKFSKDFYQNFGCQS